MKSLLTTALVLVLGGLAFAQTKVTLWHMEQPPYRVQRVQDLIDEFNEQHPDIVVNQEVQNWGDVLPKALNAARARALPEILFAIPDFAVTMKAAGAVQPVTALVEDLNDRHKFLSSALDPYDYDGEIWAVPMYGQVMNFWYRKDVFEAAGIEPPATWDELLAAAEALTSDGRYGIGLPGSHSLYTDQVIYNFMITAGAKALFDDQGNVIFDNPNTVRALEVYKDLFRFSPPDSTSWIWGDAEAAFASGTVAMIPQFTVITTYSTQTNEPASNLGVFSIPVPADGEAGAIYYSNAAMITTTDPQKAAAAGEFLSFLLEPSNYGRFLNMEPGLFLPVTEDGQDSESFWSDELVVKYRPQIERMIESSQHGALFGFTTGHVFDAIGPISAQNLLSEVVQQMLIEGQTPQAAVSWGQARMQEAQQ